jgi:glycerophosphoryl diester phosphodiesterase
MTHLLDQFTRPAVFAHRGASAFAPENTLAAFRLALAPGADGVELDAMLCGSGEIVVIHDDTVDRTSGERGLVRQMKLAQLKSLDAGSFFAPSFAGEPIPTLDEVFAEIGSRAVINVELKNYETPTDALPDKVVDLVIRHGLQDRIIFSSFHPFNLIRVRRRLPQTPAAILTLPGKPGRLLRGWLGRMLAPKYIHPYYSDVSAENMAREHRLGRRVNAWTVNEESEMMRLINIGIDGIITDNPSLARRVLEER